MEGRKRVKDHIARLDETFPAVRFSFSSLASGEEHVIQTAEAIAFGDISDDEGIDVLQDNDVEDDLETSSDVSAAPEILEPMENPWKAGESSEVEFKSTLRVSLHSSKTDDRVELACLKTVLAILITHGGSLVIGWTTWVRLLG